MQLLIIFLYIAAVGVGAICGALCRHQVGKAATEHISKDPNLKHLTGWHTAGINILGSFVLGGVFGTPVASSTSADISNVNIMKQQPPKAAVAKSTNSFINSSGMTPRMKLLLGVGFCGSFSKFLFIHVSTFVMYL
jgi:fluoride ion exporter CrcB/FEX